MERVGSYGDGSVYRYRSPTSGPTTVIYQSFVHWNHNILFCTWPHQSIKILSRQIFSNIFKYLFCKATWIKEGNWTVSHAKISFGKIRTPVSRPFPDYFLFGKNQARTTRNWSGCVISRYRHYLEILVHNLQGIITLGNQKSVQGTGYCRLSGTPCISWDLGQSLL